MRRLTDTSVRLELRNIPKCPGFECRTAALRHGLSRAPFRACEHTRRCVSRKVEANGQTDRFVGAGHRWRISPDPDDGCDLRNLLFPFDHAAAAPPEEVAGYAEGNQAWRQGGHQWGPYRRYPLSQG